MASLESKLNQLQEKIAVSHSVGDAVINPPINASSGKNSPPISLVQQAQLKSQSPPRNPIPQKERKSNLVLFGIEECPKGTPRSKRLENDEQAITTHIKGSIPSFTSYLSGIVIS